MAEYHLNILRTFSVFYHKAIKTQSFLTFPSCLWGLENLQPYEGEAPRGIYFGVQLFKFLDTLAVRL